MLLDRRALTTADPKMEQHSNVSARLAIDFAVALFRLHPEGAMKIGERNAMDAYLGRNIRKVEVTSSLPQSTSEWLNSGKIRELLPIWLLRKNGPDFPVESDHTLGMAAAFGEVLPDSELLALLETEMALNPALEAWVREGFVSTFRNEGFLDFPADWPAAGLMDTEIRCFIELEDKHATKEVQPRVQA